MGLLLRNRDSFLNLPFLATTSRWSLESNAVCLCMQGVISRGLRGWNPHVKFLFVRGKGSASPEILHQSCFSKFIYLASNVLHGIAMTNFLTATWLLRSL